jgi:hypothetical protein
MRVYDFSNQLIFNHNAWLFVGVLILFGLVGLVISFFKPNISKFIGDETNKYLDENRRIVHMIWVFSFSASLFIAGNQIINCIYVKHVDYFHKVNVDKGRILIVYYNTILGVDYVTIKMNKKNFTIIRDDRYTSIRNLLVGDMVVIKYFNDKENIEVVSVDVFNP